MIVPRQSLPTEARRREHADGGTGLLGTKQEILHVADHMPSMAADRHGVAAPASKYLSQALFRVEGFAALPTIPTRSPA
jgi:hypothetical protein